LTLGLIRFVSILPLLCALAPTGAGAAQIRYAWSGFVEPGSAPGNPWALPGDGSAVTQDDGLAYSIEVFVDEAAPDNDGTMNPGFAAFTPVSVSLILGGSPVALGAAELILNDNNPGFDFDAIQIDVSATVLGTTLQFQAEARLPLDSFTLADPAGPDLPQLFATSNPIQFGGFGGAVLTYPANAPVSATLIPTIPEPASAGLLALGLCALAWRRR
jgi:hypothetical protein